LKDLFQEEDTIPDLIPPHGGIPQPIDCQVPAAEQADFRKQVAALKKVAVSDADLSTLYRIGDGGLSPLTGPLDRNAFNRVLDEEVFIHNEKPYVWMVGLTGYSP
jgi:sulfate adenylyltransferase